ncbi:hypothetical protein ACFFJI_11620 [Allobacillus sp. GCM10007491]|uniref:Uncharacterized protein n=1 Tax=Allobacillus saliphilus TaxID=2912308 RepID=A0A941CUV4_9BACI|nr:hypothetical protein [Allobacillus saliphilus]MBR7553634.1 hypothetical protein [Allobacillus saliphilus]
MDLFQIDSCYYLTDANEEELRNIVHEVNQSGGYVLEVEEELIRLGYKVKFFDDVQLIQFPR